jgi:hypothetical protein
MRDIYMHPTIAKLAHHLDSSIDGSVATKPEPFHVPSTLSYVTCGALQIGFFAAYMLFGLWIFVAGIQWATASDSTLEIYWRSAAFGTAMFVALSVIPVAAKWLLIGRFKAQSIPIWSFAYFRFWLVKTLMRTSPAAAFIGTPLYNAYLRLMGARIGSNVVLMCQFAPVCTDLVTIGDNTIVRKDTSLLGYRAQSNFIHRPGCDREQRLRRRRERARHRHCDGRQHTARSCLFAAERPACAGWQALPWLAGGRDVL